MVLASCAAQQATQISGSTPAFEPASISSQTLVRLEPAPLSPVYPPRAMVAVNGCDVSHPYYRLAKTLVVGPAKRGELAVHLRPNCPDLADKATVTVMRAAGRNRYYLNARPLDRRTHMVLEPGRHQLYVLVMGEMVPVAQVDLEADIDYLACLGDI
jgi:hypothetical protein